MRRRAKYLLLFCVFFVMSACSSISPSATNSREENLASEELLSTPDVYSTESQVYHEAPLLAALVAKGELPSVDERLPSNPKVLQIYDEIGVYGGTLRRAYNGISDRWGPTKLIEEGIVEFYMWDSATITIEPNWADKFEANADSTEFTAHIREGLKWSDGVAVTTEDVRFWYEDVLLNSNFFPSPPANFMLNDQLGVVEIIDDYTFIIKFSSSYPLFPSVVAGESPGGLGLGLHDSSFLLPSHYLKNFHPSYTSAADLAAHAIEYDVDSWIDLWGYGPIQAWWLNPHLPVLGAWKIEIPPPAEQVVMVRNPYYHAVDSAGNQLPYIDKIVHTFFEDSDSLALWASQGLIDIQSRHINISEYSFYKRQEDSGNYQIITWKGGDTQSLFLNINASDDLLVELFSESSFRQALSVAINRHELNEIFYSGLGEARQASPSSGSPYYDKSFEEKWIEYDPELGNELLNQLGLDERDVDGYRLRADGKVLTLNISISGMPSSAAIPDFLKGYWESVGIKVELLFYDRATYEALAEKGEMEIGLWPFDRNVIIPSAPGRYLGTITDGPWAPLYGRWYATGGQEGLKPPQGHAIWRIWEAWENAKSASTADEANEYVQEMINIHRENIWIIGLVGEQPRLYIVSNNLRNFPSGLINDGTLREIGLAQLPQLFFVP